MKTILVTGASTGVGNATALYLADQGYRVLAGVRKESDAAALRNANTANLRPFILDVTAPGELDALAVELDQNYAGELAGVVNNAGIFFPGALELAPLEEIRSHLEVNLLGPIAVIKTLLPHIRRGKGRIINIGSLNGRVAAPLQGAYASSKFGLEAVSDVLRLELDHWNIPVSHLDIGLYKTAIFGKAGQDLEEKLAAAPQELREGYGGLYRLIIDSLDSGGDEGRDPIEVAQVVHRALTAKRPATRYRVGADVKAAHSLRWLLPDKAMDFGILKGLPLLAGNRFDRRE